MIKSNKGFTLIELLIVIVIIGILSGVVLSVLNPIDQINKAQDQGKKATAAAIISALERFYVTYERYPWPTLGTTPGAAGTATTVFIQGSTGINSAWLDSTATGATSLVSTTELKPDIARRPELKELQVYTYGSGLVRICFRPESTTLLAQADFLNGAVNSACPAGATCQYCVPE